MVRRVGLFLRLGEFKQLIAMKIRIKHLLLPLTILALPITFSTCSGDDDDDVNLVDQEQIDNEEEGQEGDDYSVGGAVPAEAIDLNLPSGTLWAPWNVGASKPGEVGTYFAWGETAKKTDAEGVNQYYWNTYKWTDDEGKTFTKYTVGDKTILDPEDDAATANWGGKWQMPTIAQLDELYDNCSKEWKEEGGYAEGSIAGYLLTSKKNGKTLFLPAVGRFDLSGIGFYAFYWSANLDSDCSDSDNACAVYFDSGVWGADNSYGRDHGFTVRPVICLSPE